MLCLADPQSRTSMSSEGVTKVDLQKHTPSTVTKDKNSELDKEDFQKAAQDAKDSVSNVLQNAKEAIVGESNDAEAKIKPSKVSRTPWPPACCHLDAHHQLSMYGLNLLLACLWSCSFTSDAKHVCCCGRIALRTTPCKAFLTI